MSSTFVREGSLSLQNPLLEDWILLVTSPLILVISSMTVQRVWVELNFYLVFKLRPFNFDVGAVQAHPPGLLLGETTLVGLFTLVIDLMEVDAFMEAVLAINTRRVLGWLFD